MTTLRSRPEVTPAASPTGLRRPSAAGYWIAAVLAVAGMLGAVAWAAIGAVSSVSGAGELGRAGLPGTVVTQIGEPGNVVVYFEGDGPAPSPAKFDLRVSGTDAALVPVTDIGYDLRYDPPAPPGAVGTAVASFEATEIGTYTVTSRYDPSDVAYLAVGENIGVDFAQRMAGPLLLAGAVSVLALVIAVGTAMRSARGVSAQHRRHARTTQTHHAHRKDFS